METRRIDRLKKTVDHILPFLDFSTFFKLKFLNKEVYLMLDSHFNTLDLRNTNLDKSKINLFLRKHKSLKRIILEFRDVTDDDLSYLNEGLIEINVNGCQKLTDRTLLNIASNCKSIERLELYWLISITDAGLIEVLENCPKISYLNISGCKRITNDCLLRVNEQCPLIEHFDLTRCVGLKDQCLENVAKLKNLKYLNLYALPYLECTFLNELKFCKLEYLDLSGNQKIGDEIIKKNSSSLIHLRQFILSWCLGVSDEAFNDLIPQMYQLELLSLHGNLNITDNLIQLLSSNPKIVKHLHTLDIQGSTGIHKRTKVDLLKVLPNLVTFIHHT